MSDRETLPESLRAAIFADLQPVRPLKPATARAWLLVPWSAMALVLYWVTLTPREDLSQVGIALSWGATLLQVMLALGVGVGALREATPGSTWPRTTALACTLGAFAFHIAVVLVTFAKSQYPEPPGTYFEELRFCLTRQLTIGLPILVLGLWLLFRGLPLRPAWGGTLAGLAAGLLAEASWRMICPFTHPAHMVPSHTGAIVLTMVIGALLGLGIERLRGK